MPKPNSLAVVPKPVRCAIYVRKSVDDGSSPEFSSLDAQREAAEAYVRSQAHEGWIALPTRYSDSGYSGGNLERPGVQQLLADMQAGLIDTVVVHKVDRLSRSLIDFARLMAVFEQQGVAFVSISQRFDTNAPLGRLTLNILLSFAQFEREIIAERTRDKLVAARKKGKWTGGRVILGYDLDPRGGRLVINPVEAEQVRTLFEWYLSGEPITRMATKADDLGWRNKQWTTQDGNTTGGHALRRAHFYSLLANPLYAGQVRAGDELVAGEHEAIIDAQTFELVQTKLKQNSTAIATSRTKMESLLRGLIYCSACGSPMYGTYSLNHERRYRYYLCSRSHKQGAPCTTRSVSAPAVEEAVVVSIRRVGVHPRVLDETKRIVRERLAEDLASLREELATSQATTKNLKSQRARLRQPDTARAAELKEQIRAAETRLTGMSQEINARERNGLDETDLRTTMAEFEELWKAMSTEHQSQLIRQLIEKVGFDAASGKVTVSFKSVGTRELCAK